MSKKNLNLSFNLLAPKVQKALEHIGVLNIESLKNKGSLNTFLELKVIYPSITTSVLWRLLAIEKDINLADITADLKSATLLSLKQQQVVKSFPDQIQLEFYMHEALIEARKALLLLEVPVGAVIVKDNQIIARAHNRCLANNRVTSHAELLAIDEASQFLDNYRLEGCDLYVTLEPCMMCLGAIFQARISRLIYAVKSEKMGILENHLITFPNIYKVHTAIKGGILAEECGQLIQQFFLNKREIND